MLKKISKSLKLNDAAVLRMRQQSLAGSFNVREAAQVYGVAVETIRRAVRGDTFGHLGAVAVISDEQLAEGAAASLEKFKKLMGQETEMKDRANSALDELDNGGLNGSEV